jgi:copper chaperone
MSTISTLTTATTRTILRAEGFSCPSCVAKIEKQVGRVDGVAAVKVHFASSRIEIDHNPATVGVEELVALVAKTGYAAHQATF